jgi:CheY-like chemotaxis protein
MNTKLASILLVDDDEFMNFLNSKTIAKAGIAEHVQICFTGEEALDYITRNGKFAGEKRKFIQPDIIFLDVNMPGINGWEFLQEYKLLSQSQKGNIIVVMLTTSLNPDDEELARSIDEIAEFRHKPMTEGMLTEIMAKYFPCNGTHHTSKTALQK